MPAILKQVPIHLLLKSSSLEVAVLYLPVPNFPFWRESCGESDMVVIEEPGGSRNI